MILQSGFIIFFGFLFLAFKLPMRTLLKLLGYPLTLDLAAAVVGYALHWGTFSGVMAAALAGMLVSITTSVMRKYAGYIQPGKGYIRGWRDYGHLFQQAQP